VTTAATLDASLDIGAILGLAPVVPVLVISNADHAVPLAEALVAGGLRVLEVTLRTPQALEAMRRIARAVPDAMVGAGTVLNARHCQEAADAGAQFFVSPGSTAELIAGAARTNVPLLPGAATASEVMNLFAQGFAFQKFFPAEAAGGIAMLKSLGGPLPDVKFCPTGGITIERAPDYLRLPNVVCVGGSWLVPPEALAAGDWNRIRELAAASSALKAG
jgi:2-dehydro-3-deoxyphosphogluconate aldolase/(4S)-4-hydroxy-2-oxoglutarate aldolase